MTCNLDYSYPSLREETEVKGMASYYAECASGPVSECYANATVLPARIMPDTLWSLGGVQDSNRHYIHGTGQHCFSEMGYEYGEDEVQAEDEDALFIGYIDDCYGHAITDSLRWLWFLDTPEYAAARDSVKLVCICPKPLKKWHYELFELAGLDLHRVKQVVEVTRFRSVIVPSPSLFHETRERIIWTDYYRKTVDKIIESALSKNPPVKYGSVYFSRGKWGSMDYGDEQVERVLSSAGVKIVCPETMSISEQISILQGADTFIATDGSVAHNAVFSKDASRVILLRKKLYVNPYSCFIFNMKNADVTVCDCSLSVIAEKFPAGGPYFIYPGKLLCSCFNVDKVPLFPWKEFKRYYRNIWRYKDAADRLVFPEVYASLLSEVIDETRRQIGDRVARVTGYAVPKLIREKVNRKIIRILLYHIVF